MKKLTDSQVSRLKKIIEEFPEIKKIALQFNQEGVGWGLAAGSAYFIYIGQGESLDDVDVWVAEKDNEKAAQVLRVNWEVCSSERHQAENIKIGALDIFTNCRKFRKGTPILDYRWTGMVTNRLRQAFIDGVEYRVVSPEDVALLKVANPRGKKEKEQVERLLKEADKEYFGRRGEECGLKET